MNENYILTNDKYKEYIVTNFSFAPKCNQLKERVCPFCGYICIHLSNMSTTVHYRNCYIKYITDKRIEKLKIKQKKLFYESKMKYYSDISL